jgi:hypothetical protein
MPVNLMKPPKRETHFPQEPEPGRVIAWTMARERGAGGGQWAIRGVSCH